MFPHRDTLLSPPRIFIHSLSGDKCPSSKKQVEIVHKFTRIQFTNTTVQQICWCAQEHVQSQVFLKTCIQVKWYKVEECCSTLRLALDTASLLCDMVGICGRMWRTGATTGGVAGAPVPGTAPSPASSPLPSTDTTSACFSGPWGSRGALHTTSLTSGC